MTRARLEWADVDAARERIRGIAAVTPTVKSALSDAMGHPLWLKLETLQPTGAFKVRGAVNAIARLTPEQRAAGVVCCSTGNHGRAVAFAAQRLGIEATVCLSELVPDNKVEAIETLGARVVRAGNSQDDAQREADRLSAEQGLVDIPPFDHADIIAGQGTVGLELLEDHAELTSILVPLSGGGLISGVAVAAKSINPGIRVVGISMDRGAAMAASLTAGLPVDVTESESLADSLGGGIGLHNRYTFELVRDLVDDLVLVTEDEIYRAMRTLFLTERLVVEGAAAVGHAALLAGRITLDGPGAVIVTGNNVDMSRFSDIVAGRGVRLGHCLVKGGGIADE
ncbi:MAG: hydroxyectoine utilization dehydratase EutB [Gammaproteobacteria bacterium]|nr:hydroxyectoine utilization dehydratase EutB [Gammaproteobacteria bacterium]